MSFYLRLSVIVSLMGITTVSYATQMTPGERAAIEARNQKMAKDIESDIKHGKVPKDCEAQVSCQLVKRKTCGTAAEQKKCQNVVDKIANRWMNARLPGTCSWRNEPNVLSGPGCSSTDKSSICSGIVTCNTRAGEDYYVSEATCSVDKCQNANACAEEKGYSVTPIKEFKKQQKILNAKKASATAVEQ